MVASFGGDVILPGDPRWMIGDVENFVLLDAALAGPDAFVFALALEGEFNSLADAYSRFYRYDAGRWLCVEVDMAITGLLVLNPPGSTGDSLVVLGEEGQVWFVGQVTHVEQVPKPSSEPYDSGLTFLKNCGSMLFAGGLGGQCCMRQSGAWVRHDEGILGHVPRYPRMRSVDLDQPADLKDIVVLPNGDQYACGSLATCRPALYHRPASATGWHWLGSGVDDPDYDFMVFRAMMVEPPDAVWITTDRGVLFRGNAARGFGPATKPLREPLPDGSDRLVMFDQLLQYRGALHVQSSAGPLRLRSDGDWDPLPGLPPKLGAPKGTHPRAGGILEASGDVLWSMSRNAARFDGQAWERITMPPIRD